MKTDRLISLLATGAGRAPQALVAKRVGLAAAIGLGGSLLGCVGLLGFNVGLMQMGPALVVKLLYLLAVLGASAWWLGRVARPLASARAPAVTLVATLLSLAAWAAAVWLAAAPDARGELLFGQSWTSCPWRVAALSLPAWGMAFWALRGLAPTRPRVAGFAAGLFAGGAGALGYALYCTELSPAFVLVWYSLGILAPAAAGALAGGRLLRW